MEHISELRDSLNGHFNHDNGRILGYDNCHGKHHRHYMGKEETFEFTGYEDISEQFKKEWRIIHEEINTTKNS
jgi:hypothetical protein